MSERITYVGLDAHKVSITMAVLRPGMEVADEPVKFKNTPQKVRKIIRRLKTVHEELKVCYEAGPTGYELQRQFWAEGVECDVVAPSLIPQKSGSRVKTDRIDAKKLAELHRAGLLTPVTPPTEDDEAARDLVRLREDLVSDVKRAKQQLNALLLRHGVSRPHAKAWTKRDREWLQTLKMSTAMLTRTLRHHVQRLERAEAQRDNIELDIAALSETEAFRRPVGALRCFRGIDTISAMTIVTELHSFGRFEKPTALMAFIGLVPSEDSTGDRVNRGPITKTGNKRVRRILVEAGWHYRHKPAVGVTLRKRRQGQPPEVIATADRAMQRLWKRYWHLVFDNNKAPCKAVTAVARELAGFIWAVLYPMATEDFQVG
jgi:transposase